MTAITYSAKRNIETTGFSTGTVTDIEAGFVGVSPEIKLFNSTDSPATDLSGLLQDQYILVTGFTNSTNNGWFQVASDSTATQINVVEQTSSENAGDSVSITGYYRGSGVSYDLETSGKLGTVIGDEGMIKQAISLSGARETLFFRRKETYEIMTGVIPGADFPQWREFFASVMGGETFSLDPYGSIAVPDNVQTVYLIGRPNYSRIANFDRYFITFRVEVA